MCLVQGRRNDFLPAKASYSEVHNLKMVVFFSTHDGMQDKLPATFRDNKYKISSVGMAIGQLGLPPPRPEMGSRGACSCVRGPCKNC